MKTESKRVNRASPGADGLKRVAGLLLMLFALASVAFACSGEADPTATQPAPAATQPAATSTPAPTQPPAEAPSEPLSVVTTIYTVTWFTEQVGGDRVSVISLVKPGVDAHDFEPTPSDIITISEADVFVLNHPAFEGWAANALENVGQDSILVIQAADLPEGIVFEDDHGHDEEDEHGHDEEDDHADEEDDHGHDEEDDHADEEDDHGHDEEDDHADEEDDHADEEDDHADEEDDHGHDEEDDHADEEDDHGHDEEDDHADEEDEHGHDEEEGEHHDEEGDHAHDEEGAIDPHVWLDPLQAITQVRRIQEGLTKADPDGAAVFKANADALVEKIADVDDRMGKALVNCRLDHIVVSHLAYGHLAERYDLEQIGLSGLSADFESGPRQIAEIVDQMRELGVKHILQEPISGTGGLAETVAAEADAEVLKLHPMESLTEDETAAGEDYLSIMDNNIESLKTALDCSPS